METKSPAYVWGFAIGAVVGVALVAVVIRLLLGKRTKRSREYDERQQLAIGKGYKYGYYTLLIYLAVYALVDQMTGARWCSVYTGAFIGVLLSVGVFGVICIRNDAYLPLRESPGRYISIFMILGGLNVVLGVVHYIEEGTFMEDGILSASIVNPLAGMLLLFLAAALAVKTLSEKRAERETERNE